MGVARQGTYRFGPFLLDSAERQLLRDGQPISLPPKVFDALVFLVSNNGRLLEEAEFLDQVWNGSFVEEVALPHAISHLRKALGDADGSASWIETVPKRGYRFRAPVTTMTSETAAESAPSAMVVAVLPFAQIGPAQELEYIAEGLLEELIAALGQVDSDQVSVIGRTSMLAYRHTTKSLTEIGRELGAAFLVESSVRAENGRVRIVSKLIRARDQVQIWSAAYDSEPSSVLDLQRDLSSAIAREVHSRLSPHLRGNLARRQTTDPQAYDFYLRGRFCWNQLSAQSTRRAIEFYERATQIDPAYALAWAGMAIAWASGPISGDAPPMPMWSKAQDAIDRALGAGAELAEVQTAHGVCSFWLDWKWRTAERALARAISFDPSHSLAHRFAGIVASHRARHVEAQAAMQRARELDPLDATHQALSAQVAFNAHDHGSALAFARRAVELEPQFWVAGYQLAMAHEQAGDYASALDALATAEPFSNGNSKIAGLRGYVLARMGCADAAREILNSLLAAGNERFVPPYGAALIHSGLDDRESALQELRRGLDCHDVHLALLGVDSKWDAMREVREFQSILERCGFERD